MFPAERCFLSWLLKHYIAPLPSLPIITNELLWASSNLMNRSSFYLKYCQPMSPLLFDGCRLQTLLDFGGSSYCMSFRFLYVVLFSLFYKCDCILFRCLQCVCRLFSCNSHVLQLIGFLSFANFAVIREDHLSYPSSY